MHWIAFAILVYAATVVQTTLAPFIAIHSIQPDLMIIVAVHYALAARAQDAMLACWLIGLVMDLSSLSFAGHANVGSHALALGLIALVIVKVRDLTFRDSVVTQFVFTFLAKLGLGILIGAYLVYLVKLGPTLPEHITYAFYSAAYTAVLAPYGHWLLKRMRGVLGLGTAHRVRIG